MAGNYQGHAPQIKQLTLFGGVPPIFDEETEYRGPTASRAAGTTCRQLDYQVHTGLVKPTIRNARGSDSQRLHSFRNIPLLKVVKCLLDMGIFLQQIRVAVVTLSSMGADGLAPVTLMSNGISVYTCTLADEAIDLMQGGQGVFGIVVDRVWREIEDTLAELSVENLHDASNPEVVDELARRRAARHANQFRDGVGLGLGLFPVHEVSVEVLVYSKVT